MAGFGVDCQVSKNRLILKVIAGESENGAPVIFILP